ncbi:hypothetical protein Ancab_019698 [Ancistrocladus abbreviatus]
MDRIWKGGSGFKPFISPAIAKDSKIGRIDANTFSRYAGCEFFSQLPLSKKTKDGLRQAEYIKMTEIQRASLPHSLCGRDILGASKNGVWEDSCFCYTKNQRIYIPDKLEGYFGLGKHLMDSKCYFGGFCLKTWHL